MLYQSIFSNQGDELYEISNHKFFKNMLPINIFRMQTYNAFIVTH